MRIYKLRLLGREIRKEKSWGERGGRNGVEGDWDGGELGGGRGGCREKEERGGG